MNLSCTSKIEILVQDIFQTFKISELRYDRTFAI
jgi:hypothetical protein